MDDLRIRFQESQKIRILQLTKVMNETAVNQKQKRMMKNDKAKRQLE